MTENIPVKCLTERFWDPLSKTFSGTEKSGTLIDVSLQSAEDDSGRAIPVGIVLFEDNSFDAVPLEFITKNI